MEFKDYYATLGVAPSATQDEVKRAYRKLARKYHPDVSKEADAEARFKEVAEAHEALIDPERRAAYDAIAQRHGEGQAFEPPPGWDSGFEYSGRGPEGQGGRGHPGAMGGQDFSDFFESLFGRAEPRGPGGPGGARRRAAAGPLPGSDHHAKVAVALEDACHGAQRTITLRAAAMNAEGQATLQERQLEVRIPKGVRPGQHLRLAGQGAAGQGGGPPGDLYLEVQFLPHPVFRVDGGDLAFDLPLAPWEAALGATVVAPTPDGAVELAIPAGSSAGRRLRLKGRGLPGQPGQLPGDLYAVLAIALPAAASAPEKAAYAALAAAFPTYNPRAALEA